MQEILTPEQWKEYREKMMAEMKELREKAQARKQAQNGDDKKGDDMGKGRN